MPTIQTTHVCKSKKHKGKMLAVLLDDSGKTVIRTDTPATSEEITAAMRPMLKGRNLLKLFTKQSQQAGANDK